MLGRSILQKSKQIHFDNEDGWDLTFKTYNQLIEAKKTAIVNKQGLSSFTIFSIPSINKGRYMKGVRK